VSERRGSLRKYSLNSGGGIWPNLMLDKLAEMGKRGEPLPTVPMLMDALGLGIRETQTLLQLLEARGSIHVTRDQRNERLAIYAPDGSWRLERRRRGGVPQKAPARRCLCCRRLWEPPHKQRWICDLCRDNEVMGS
jgi:hypothetical protein